MEFASHLDLPTTVFHVDSQLINEFGDFLGAFLFSFVLDSADSWTVSSLSSINELNWHCGGVVAVPVSTVDTLGMESFDCFTIMIRVAIIDNRDTELSL